MQMRKILLIPLLFLFLAFPAKAIAYAPSPFIQLNETQILYWNIYNANDYGDAALIGYYENSYAGQTFQNFLVWNNTFGASTLINFQYKNMTLISKLTYNMPTTTQYYYDTIRCQPQDKGDNWVSFYCLFYHSTNLANSTNVTIYFQPTTGYATSMNATNFSATTFTSSLYFWNDFNYNRHFTAFNGSNVLHVWNKEEAFDLSLPTIFYQYFDALALVDPLTDRVFVFTVANHPSHAGYRYLYELKFKKSTGEFLGFDTLFTGNELTTLGGYIEEGYIRLYSFDWTNNRWQIFYMGAIAYTSEEGWYVPLASYDTASISLGYPTNNPMGSTTYIINTGLVKDVVTKQWNWTYTLTANFNFTYGNTTITDSYNMYFAGLLSANILWYSRLHDLRQFPLGANITVVAWCNGTASEQCLGYGFEPLNNVYRDFPIILPQNITISMISYVFGRPGFADNYWYHIIVRNFAYVAPPSFYFTEFDVTPSSGYANYTTFTAKFSIVPVSPPYNVTLYKNDVPVWAVTGTSDYTWEVSFTSDVGTYYLQAKAVNSLGQIAYSDIKTISVTEYTPTTTSTTSTTLIIPPFPTYPPWLNLINIMLSPFWIVLLMVFGMSAAIESKLQAGGMAFLAALIIFLFVFAFYTKTIPLWIPIIFLIIAFGYIMIRGRI